MKRTIAAITILVCIYFDSVFFPYFNILGVRPDMMLCAAVAFGVLAGPLSGALVGGIGGLLMDILFGRMLGFNAALYLVVGMVGGMFYQKFYADNPIIPGVVAARRCT